MRVEQGVNKSRRSRMPGWLWVTSRVLACLALLYGVVQLGQIINNHYGLPINPYGKYGGN